MSQHARFRRSHTQVGGVLLALAAVTALAQQAPPAAPAANPPASASTPAPSGTPPAKASAPAAETLPPAPASSKPSPQRFEPTEKVRPDFDVAFPVDI